MVRSQPSDFCIPVRIGVQQCCHGVVIDGPTLPDRYVHDVRRPLAASASDRDLQAASAGSVQRLDMFQEGLFRFPFAH